MPINLNHKKNNKAFSLIEVLIFVSVITIFFVVSVSVTTVSLRNMKINEHKIKAAHYAEELVEWIRSYKEIDWLSFTSKVDNDNSDGSCEALSYCFNTLDNDFSHAGIWPAAGQCTTTGLNPVIYKREVTLKPESACGGTLNQIHVRVDVRWSELNNNYDTPLETILSVWEK